MNEELHRTQRLLGETMSNLAAVQEHCNQLQHERDEAVILAGNHFNKLTQVRRYLHGVLKLGLEKDLDAFKFYFAMFCELDKEFGK